MIWETALLKYWVWKQTRAGTVNSKSSGSHRPQEKTVSFHLHTLDGTARRQGLPARQHGSGAQISGWPWAAENKQTSESVFRGPETSLMGNYLSHRNFFFIPWNGLADNAALGEGRTAASASGALLRTRSPVQQWETITRWRAGHAPYLRH